MDYNEYYLNIAKAIGEKSTCLRRKFGAVIVKNNVIMGTGFNGPARGCTHCDKVGCLREKMNIPNGQRYELCRSVHAEQNAIINSSGDIRSATLYIYCDKSDDIEPCMMCKRVILNAQIEKVVTKNKIFNVKDFIDADLDGNDNYGDKNMNSVSSVNNCIDKQNNYLKKESDLKKTTVEEISLKETIKLGKEIIEKVKDNKFQRLRITIDNNIIIDELSSYLKKELSLIGNYDLTFIKRLLIITKIDDIFNISL